MLVTIDKDKVCQKIFCFIYNKAWKSTKKLISQRLKFNWYKSNVKQYNLNQKIWPNLHFDFTAELGDYNPTEHTPALISEFRFHPEQDEEMEIAILEKFITCRYYFLDFSRA